MCRGVGVSMPNCGHLSNTVQGKLGGMWEATHQLASRFDSNQHMCGMPCSNPLSVPPHGPACTQAALSLVLVVCPCQTHNTLSHPDCTRPTHPPAPSPAHSPACTPCSTGGCSALYCWKNRRPLVADTQLSCLMQRMTRSRFRTAQRGLPWCTLCCCWHLHHPSRCCCLHLHDHGSTILVLYNVSQKV